MNRPLPNTNRPSDAIPARGRDRRRLDARLWPFSYETSPEVIRTAVADYDRILGIERGVLAWALKQGRRLVARNTRAFIDHVELRRRNGIARLSTLEQEAAA